MKEIVWFGYSWFCLWLWFFLGFAYGFTYGFAMVSYYILVNFGFGLCDRVCTGVNKNSNSN